MILDPRIRLSLTPEEGAVLGQLADNPQGVTRFMPAARSQWGYRAFNVDIVWPLEQLRGRGFVRIEDRKVADTASGEVYWDGVAAQLTEEGKEAVGGRPRNSVGLPGIPEG